MICGHVCVFLRMMSFCLCENQISPVLTYNAPWHVMTDLFASSRFIYGFGGGSIHIVSWFKLAAHLRGNANRHFHVTAFSLR